MCFPRQWPSLFDAEIMQAFFWVASVLSLFFLSAHIHTAVGVRYINVLGARGIKCAPMISYRLAIRCCWVLTSSTKVMGKIFLVKDWKPNTQMPKEIPSSWGTRYTDLNLQYKWHGSPVVTHLLCNWISSYLATQLMSKISANFHSQLDLLVGGRKIKSYSL